MLSKDISPTVDHLLHESRQFPPFKNIQKQAHLKSFSDYQSLYKSSLEDEKRFWLSQAESLDWFKKPSIACRYTWDTASRHIEHRWFEDGTINVSFNCLDRHLKLHANKTALIWQGDSEESVRQMSYAHLHESVCRFANVLKSLDIRKGDRVCLYMPMVPEAAIAMLACARIGAIHSVVFGGFSAESLAHRINDASCKLLITASGALRGGKLIPLKEIADEALVQCPSIESVVVVQHTDAQCQIHVARDVWYHEKMAEANANCPAEPLNAEDPLFILYTSGSTGKPKGVVHTQAGYLLHAALSHRLVFDIQPQDVYWCTADVGWITGHSYSIYGPLTNGSTILLFEGIPTYPDPGRFWQIIDKFQVSIFYTAPTAIRALISKGDEWPNRYQLTSLRILGSVGEPINPQAWMWYRDVIGKGRCPVIDTWWQTETGGIMIAPLPGCHTTKPGSATQPFFGVEPVILKDDGTPCQVNEGGALCIKKPWPGMMRTTWGDHDRFIDTYFSTFPNMYFSGDGCRVDEDGDYWLLGRIDDVVNVSGHRIGTAEIESALVSHPAVAEAAAVPVPHAIKGQDIVVFVTVKQGINPDEALKRALSEHIRQTIGPIAVPQEICFASSLPKTRSGKIIRRILRCVASDQWDALGDTSTLADPSILEELLKSKKRPF